MVNYNNGLFTQVADGLFSQVVEVVKMDIDFAAGGVLSGGDWWIWMNLINGIIS